MLQIKHTGCSPEQLLFCRSTDYGAFTLVGLGEEWKSEGQSEDKIRNAYSEIAKILEDKNCFILSTCEDGLIFDSIINRERIAAPFRDDVLHEADEEYSPFDRDMNPMWDKYMKWLSCTLNKKLVILEMGCLLGKDMRIVRWPFEKTVMYNLKSELIRVNETCPFIPAEISERATSIKCNSVDFLL